MQNLVHEIKARPNFDGMFEDEDPDAYDRLRDQALEDGLYRPDEDDEYGWNAIRREVYR